MDSVTEYTDFLERQLLLNPTPENAHALAAVYRLRDALVERESGELLGQLNAYGAKVHRDFELTRDERALEEGSDDGAMHWEKYDGSMGIWETPDYDAVNSAFDPFELEHIIEGSISADELSTMSTSTAAKTVTWSHDQPDVIVAEVNDQPDSYDDVYELIRPARTQVLTFPKALSIDLWGNEFGLSGNVVIRVTQNGTRLTLEQA